MHNLRLLEIPNLNMRRVKKVQHFNMRDLISENLIFRSVHQIFYNNFINIALR